MTFELSADGIYWAASTFAQSAVALLAFGAFLAIWRMDKLLSVAHFPIEHLSQAIGRSRGAQVTFQDPKRGRDLIDFGEYVRRVAGPPPPVETRDPVAHIESLVGEASHYLAQQPQAKADLDAGTLVIQGAVSAGDALGFERLRERLEAARPVAELLSRISYWLRVTSLLGMVGFGIAMLLVGNAKLVVALPRLAGFLVVATFAVSVIATTLAAAMLARWCFTGVAREL